MKRQLRTIVFWLHLSSGVVAGLIVLVMAATGTVLAFQPQLIDWAESGSRRVTPRGQTTLGTEAILARAREVRPRDTATALTIYADHASAVRVATGRDSGVHVDYTVTGAVLQREGYGDYSRGRKLRTWLRFLHTGEALGWGGQFVAGLASLGATLLVWTGLSLAIRRLLRWRPGRSFPSPE